jgi:hypothetical protein
VARSRFVVETLVAVVLSMKTMEAGPVRAQRIETVFVPLKPCRVVDSRIALGTTGPLEPGVVHNVYFHFQCGIPNLTLDGGSEVNQATAVAMNIVAVSPAGFGHLTAWPTNQAIPESSVINYSPGQNVANGVVVPMCDEEVDGARACEPEGDISFRAAVSAVHLVVDVTGYYIKPVRPGTGRHGAGAGFDSFPCINNLHQVRFGLSSHMAQAEGSEALCPHGTWLCTSAQVGSVGCDTSRADTACDGRTCAGVCLNDPADNHRGWTATINVAGEPVTINEAGVSATTSSCEQRPAWCCSKN